MPKQTEAQAKRRLTQALTKQKEVICLDETSYIVTLLHGRELAMKGKEVAKVIKGY